MYSPQVLSVLVDDRHRSIRCVRRDAARVRLRSRAAHAVYALAKVVIVVAVALDDDPLRGAAERAR